MKKLLITILSILSCLFFSLGLVACNNENTNNTSTSNHNAPVEQGFSLTTNIENCTIDGTKIRFIVSNETDSFSFINAFNIPEDYKWELHWDKSCLPSLNIVSKSVNLEEGNNILYALFVNKNNTDNIFLYEILAHRSHTITISYYEDNALLHTEQILSGQKFTSSYEPTFIGYDFDYWEIADGEIFQDTMLLSSINVYAKKSPIEYTITYNLNGGQAISNNNQKVNYGDNYELYKPVKNGYTFLGWYKDSIKIENGVWEYTENLTVTAKWISGEAFYENGQLFVYYGTYPQTYVSDANIINALNNIGTFNEKGYRVYNNEEYTAMYNYSSYDEYPAYPSLCYFKVEPILWRVVLDNNGEYTLVSEYVLDNYYWGSSQSYCQSDLRNGLINNFYNEFFTDYEKSKILNTVIDNSANSTNGTYNYDTTNTTDKIFLLSNMEVENFFPNANQRIAKATDYAKVNYVETNSSGNAYWLTRSRSSEPTSSYGTFSVSIYTAYGNRDSTQNDYTVYGIRPAIRIL